MLIYFIILFINQSYMLKLLNRFAWLISILFCISIISIDEDLLFFWIISIFIVKFVFLSEGFIRERLQYFLDKVKNDVLENLDKNKISEKIENNEETYTINQNCEISNVKASYIDDTKYAKDWYSNEEQENKDNLLNLDFKEINNNFHKISIDDLENQKIEKSYTEKIVSKPTAIEESFAKLIVRIKEFFSENLLVKLWWIIVFLGALFLLKDFVGNLWPIWKLSLWIVLWLSIYIWWTFLYNIGFKNEWLILFWVSFLVNYLIILSGRYLLWDNWNMFFSVGLTFFLLILNTIFATVTSMVYDSRNLLIFSFIFAYINPFLIWWSSTNPYTLVWYSMIVSLAWLFLSNYRKDNTLLIISFFFWNFLFLVSTSWSEIGYITKIVAASILSLFSIIIIYKNNPKYLTSFFVWTYLFLMLLLGSGWHDLLKETWSFIISILSIVLFLWFWVFYFLKTFINWILPVLIAPIFLILWIMIGNGNLYLFPFVVLSILTLYLVWFSFIVKQTTQVFNYVFFVILWIFILSSNIVYIWLYSLWDSLRFWTVETITFFVTSFIFLITSYYLSTKKDLWYLYAIWTLFSVFILSTVINVNLGFENILKTVFINPDLISALAIILFALMNLITPFFNKNLIEEKTNLKSLLIWNIFWILFIWFQLYSFWLKYFPWVTIWLAFVWLAIVYFAISYALINNIWIQNIKEKSILWENSRNVVYTYMWISITIFSLAILLVFSKSPEIISTIWLLQASLMYFFFQKTNENKILLAWNTLFLVWIVNLFWLIDNIVEKDFRFLVPFSIIFISFVLNIKFLDTILNKEKRIFHDIFHIIWIWILWFFLMKIIPSTHMWWSTIWISIFVLILSIVYSFFSSNTLKSFFVFVFVSFCFFHISDVNQIFYNLESNWKTILKILQYSSTFILWLWFYFWSILNKEKSYSTILKLLYFIYLFIITTIYIKDIFGSSFSITIYWWVLSFISILYWLNLDVIKFRTVWLYILSLTAGKIFLYDVWEIKETNMRVIAFIVIWILFIIIWTAYSKKMWSKLKWEFDFKNLKDMDVDLGKTDTNLP